jgi:outer membrane protein TolC
MNLEASLKAYQADVTGFTTLMRAQLSDLQTQLELLRLRIERAQAQARLLYLAGDES